ncbi:hypothetical protein CEXT_574201 [Caerostris extrusa]|uniref:Uncharacterized protein n=1 Tax=Caerostris extrusa TaxID=172846 RepID=A0AAV4PAB5_CAEEX|nr:hypothetical protein CEXT_574201 [Caerostris extrusa]
MVRLRSGAAGSNSIVATFPFRNAFGQTFPKLCSFNCVCVMVGRLLPIYLFLAADMALMQLPQLALLPFLRNFDEPSDKSSYLH